MNYQHKHNNAINRNKSHKYIYIYYHSSYLKISF